MDFCTFWILNHQKRSVHCFIVVFMFQCCIHHFLHVAGESAICSHLYVYLFEIGDLCLVKFDLLSMSEYYYNTKKRQHSFDILKSFFFIRHSSEYENIGLWPKGDYPTFSFLIAFFLSSTLRSLSVAACGIFRWGGKSLKNWVWSKIS